MADIFRHVKDIAMSSPSIDILLVIIYRWKSEQLARTDVVSCSSGVVYAQSACHEDLLSLQGCLPDSLDSRDVYISATDQEAVEAQENNLLNNLVLLKPSQSVKLLSSHSCVCTYSGCVTAVAQPTSPLLSNVYSLAQMCVQLSGLRQTASSEHLDCHLCQNVHLSQALQQHSVVIDCSFPHTAS